MILKFNSEKDNLFFSSDLHCLHKNICYGTSTWDNKEESTRKFKHSNEMTNHIIDNINNTVGIEDHLFLLGDLLFNFKGVDVYTKIINRINCNNIYLLFGNHDNRANLQEAAYSSTKKIIVSDYLEIEVDKILICMLHYPMEEWNDRHGRSIHLFGHVHSRLPHGNRRIDVGIDNYFKLFGEYKPFSWKEITKLLDL